MLAIQANPQSVRASSDDVSETITSFIFALCTWHIPPDNLSPALLNGTYGFMTFPAEYSALQQKMGAFLHHLKQTEMEDWNSVEKNLPINVRRLLQEQYHL